MIKKFEVGDRAKVHQPAMRDAAGNEFGLGKHHGQTGTVMEVTEWQCGNQRLYSVLLDGYKLWYPFWTDELRLTPGGGHMESML